MADQHRLSFDNVKLPASDLTRGTGHHKIRSDNVLAPASIAGLELQFFTATTEFTALLVHITDGIEPCWFGVAVPSGVTETHVAHIFFHPYPTQVWEIQPQPKKGIPGKPFYQPQDYASFSGHWPRLFSYVETIGIQIGFARKKQILIIPFLKNTVEQGGLGRLTTQWEDIITTITMLALGNLHLGIADLVTFWLQCWCLLHVRLFADRRGTFGPRGI